MDITPVISKERQRIETYGDGEFKISGKVYTGSVIVTPERTREWPVQNIGAVSFESFITLFEENSSVELLLIGSGDKFQPLNPNLRNSFKLRKMAVDAMDTGAACRTYNILMAEGRRVAAALVAV
jgi:uncharacterized protein